MGLRDAKADCTLSLRSRYSWADGSSNAIAQAVDTRRGHYFCGLRSGRSGDIDSATPPENRQTACHTTITCNTVWGWGCACRQCTFNDAVLPSGKHCSINWTRELRECPASACQVAATRHSSTGQTSPSLTPSIQSILSASIAPSASLTSTSQSACLGEDTRCITGLRWQISEGQRKATKL